MPDILLRNVDPIILKRLKSSAKRHQRSLQAEIHEILDRASARSLAETRRLSAKWLKRLQHSRQPDSTKLVREDRDSR